MRHPSAPDNNGNPQRNRTRGAIRTHLGRKRTGPHARRLDGATLGRIRETGNAGRHRQEDTFDRLMGEFQSLFESAGEKGAAAFDAALDTACETLVTAGEFTAGGAQRFRELLRRDVLHRDHPAITFRTGDITTAGTLICESCGWTIVAARTTLLAPCPQCSGTSFRKTG